MYIKRKKKKAITLLEIMIVIFLIGLIGSVIGYNVKGSLEEGKAFRTQQGAARIQDILLMEIANGAEPETVAANPEKYLLHSGVANQAKKLLKDGWGKPYIIKAKGDNITVKSEALIAYQAKKKAKLPPGTQTKTEEAEESDEEA